MKQVGVIAAIRFGMLMFTCACGVAAAEETKPTEAVINNCVNITMSVKGCGTDFLAPCESSFCYQTYDYKLSELGPMQLTDAAPATLLTSSPSGKKQKTSHKKSKHHRHPDSA